MCVKISANVARRNEESEDDDAIDIRSGVVIARDAAVRSMERSSS